MRRRGFVVGKEHQQRREDKTNGFTQPVFRKEIETGLMTALKDFEDNALLPAR